MTVPQGSIPQVLAELVSRWRTEAAERRAKFGRYDEYADQQECDAKELLTALRSLASPQAEQTKDA